MIRDNLKCKTCAVWAEVEGLNQRCGQCRKHAPFQGDRIPQHEPKAFYAEWPFTKPHDFCGDHVARMREDAE